MHSHTEYLTLTVPQRMDFVNITSKIRHILEESGIQEGLCLVNAMHITASVFLFLLHHKQPINISIKWLAVKRYMQFFKEFVR